MNNAMMSPNDLLNQMAESAEAATEAATAQHEEFVVDAPEFDLMKVATPTGRAVQELSGWVIGEEREALDPANQYVLDITNFQHGWYGFVDKGDGKRKPIKDYLVSVTEPRAPTNPRPDLTGDDALRPGYRIVLNCVRGSQVGRVGEISSTSGGMQSACGPIAAEVNNRLAQAKRDGNVETAQVFPVVTLDHGEFQGTKGAAKGKYFLKPKIRVVGWTDMYLSDFTGNRSVIEAPKNEKPEATDNPPPAGRRARD